MRNVWIIGLVATALASGCGREPVLEIVPGTRVQVPGRTQTETPATVLTIAVTDDNTGVDFVGTKHDGKHDGGFRSFSGKVEFDPADLTTTRFTLEIDTDSLWTDDDKLTGHLKAPDFFEVKAYPTASFKTTSVSLTTGEGYMVTGDLTLHGVTKSISFTALMEYGDGGLSISAGCTINRHDFGITYGKGKVHDDVSITLSFAGSP